MLSHVNWPYQYDPRRSAIYALNDVDVKAPPEVVWRLLVDGTPTVRAAFSGSF